MIAYFALLSFVPLLFLTVSLLGLANRPDESSYLVTELKRAFPGSSVASIVHTVDAIREHATALGIVGGAALIWASLSLFSVLESAMNIVYGQPNRSFLRGKLLAVGLMLLSLVTLFLGLLIGSFGFDLLKRYVGWLAGNPYVAYGLSVVVSLLGIFLFLRRGLLLPDQRRAHLSRTCCPAPCSRRSRSRRASRCCRSTSATRTTSSP